MSVDDRAKELNAALGRALEEMNKPQAMLLSEFQKFYPLFNHEMFENTPHDVVLKLREEYNRRVDQTMPLSILGPNPETGETEVIFQLHSEFMSIPLLQSAEAEESLEEMKRMRRSYAHPSQMAGKFNEFEETMYNALSESDKVMNIIRDARAKTDEITERFKEVFPNSDYSKMKLPERLKPTMSDEDDDDLGIL